MQARLPAAAAAIDDKTAFTSVSLRSIRAAGIVAVLVLATALRAYGLVRQSAWADEITTLFIADPTATFWQFWQRVLSDTHPPLYYLLMREWFTAFGASDLSARLPSAIFGVLAVAAITPAFRSLSLRARLTLMLFLAASPGAIEYSQEARSYSLLLFLSVVITGACWQFIRAQDAEGRDATRALIVMTVAGVTASYTHYFGFLAAVAAGLTALTASFGNRRRGAAAVLSLAIIISLFLPWVGYHAHYLTRDSYGVRMSQWIATFPLDATISWFIRLWLGGTAGLLSVATLAVAFLPMRSFRALVRRDAAWRVALLLPLVTIAAALVISSYTPVLTSRNLIVILPALYLAMAAFAEFGATRWGNLAMATGLGATLLLMMQPLPWYYTAQSKEQWRESAAVVLAQPGCRSGAIYVYGDAANYHALIDKDRPRLQLVEIPLGGGPVPPLASPADCSVLLWAADLPRAKFDSVLAALPADLACVRVEALYWAFVAVREPTVSPGRGGCEPTSASGP